MLNPASEFCILLSVICIICILVCSAECEKCPRKGVCKPLSYDACTFVKSCYNGLQNSSYTSYLSLGYSAQHQKTVTLDSNTCLRSELGRLSSALCGYQSEVQCVKSGDLDIDKSDSEPAVTKQTTKSESNVSWPLTDVVFRLPDGRIVTCYSSFNVFDRAKISPSPSSGDQIVQSSCRGHLQYKNEVDFSLWDIDLEKLPSSDSSSPRVNVSPSNLNWGQNYLYHSSLAFLSLKNTCNETVLKIYEPLSTDSQFYPFNFSEVVLGPGELTSISFAYLPSTLGLSSAELVLQTSIGGFLVEAKGFAVESPYRLRPLVGLDASFSGRLSRKVSLSNPFDETIDLEEVTASFSVYKRTGSLSVESICSKQKPDANKLSSSGVDHVPNGESGQLDHRVMGVRPLNNWLISPRKIQSILEMTFSPDTELKVVGAVCMKLFRPLRGEKSTLVVPFEAELEKTTSQKETASSLSVSVEAVSPCDTAETTISVSVQNMGSHLLKIVKIKEVDSKTVLQIKYFEGLLLFPGTVSQVAIVTYESSNAEYHFFHEMPDLSISCKLEILVNDTVSPLLEVPCLEIFGICPRQVQESPSYMLGNLNPSTRARSSSSTENLPILTKAPRGIEADEFVHEEWRTQSSVTGHYLLNDHELLFPLVSIGKYYAKSITVKNPSQQPVIVQFILNSEETVDNCKTCYGHQQSPSLSSSICNDSTRVSMHGFSVSDSSVTEVFLHPHGTASLGPILFHPSNRCEWKSSAFIRSNLSGLELLSLRGFGGSLSLVMLEGSKLMQRLDFNINLPFPSNESNTEDTTPACRRPLFKKLFAVNAGDFVVEVKRIDVSGRECGLDGFVVHNNCRGFSLQPGESLELWLSYQSDFSVPVVRRELELNLGVGILAIPMQASIPSNTLDLCGKSKIWRPVQKICWFTFIILVVVALRWLTVLSDSKIKDDKKSIPTVRPQPVSSTILFDNQGDRKAVKLTTTGHIKQGLTAEHTDRPVDCQTAITPSSDGGKEIDISPSLPSKSISVKNAEKLDVAQPVRLTVKTRNEKRRRLRKRSALIEVCSSHSGNSTPSSPLSPVTTLSPPETCSSPLEKIPIHGCCSPEPPVVVLSARAPENQNHQQVSTQQPPSPSGLKKMGSRAMLLPSATFPGSAGAHNSHIRCEIALDARAPGPKIQPPKPVQSEGNRRVKEDKFVYDIWGNHFSGLHLCKPNSSLTINPGTIGQSTSFFLRGPQKTLLTNSQPPYVSSLCNEG